MSRKTKRKLARLAARMAQRNDPNPAPTAQQQLIARLGVQIERFSGPLPPPEVLEKYNAIEPGSANRIIRMAESQAQHRQSLERTVIESRTRSDLKNGPRSLAPFSLWLSAAEPWDWLRWGTLLAAS